MQLSTPGKHLPSLQPVLPPARSRCRAACGCCARSDGIGRTRLDEGHEKAGAGILAAPEEPRTPLGNANHLASERELRLCPPRAAPQQHSRPPNSATHAGALLGRAVVEP